MVIYGWLMRFFLVIGNCPCWAGGACAGSFWQTGRYRHAEHMLISKESIWTPKWKHTVSGEKTPPGENTHVSFKEHYSCTCCKYEQSLDGGCHRYCIRASGYRLFTKVTTAIVDRHIQWQIDCFLIHKESQIWIKYSSSGFRRASQDAGRRMMVQFC